ncbi:MAG: histidine--tRNA ligase [Candidatus Omnitrophica bacterium]|nr:histidine--tRNA ligase [Candidatus Omnitrophota bacterium]
MFNRVPGTKDILPDQVRWWQDIERTSRKIFSIHNYQEIRPPLIEDAALFTRSLGEATEIVQKQMFIIKREEDLYALRPEGTASIVRAYLENNLDKTGSFVKFYYMGPMFRAERPQKGRLRQFHHIGVEAIGSKEPEIDVEVIALADTLLKAYSIQGYSILINSLGCPKDKKELTRILRDNLKDKLEQLCPDCQARFDKNVFRILDCKNESCQNIVSQINIGNTYLCPDCAVHFQRVKAGLDSLGIKYETSPKLVRGLDYYTRTVFEFKHGQLGLQQDALGAGGRYDALVKELGGPETGAIGFAFGVERLNLAAGTPEAALKDNLVYLVTLGEQARFQGLKILADLRQAGIKADTDYENKSLKAAMRKANDLGAGFVLILGDDELKDNAVMVKDMKNSTQEKVPLDKLGDYLANKGKS